MIEAVCAKFKSLFPQAPDVSKNRVQFVDLLEFSNENRFFVRPEKLNVKFGEFHARWNEESQQSKELAELVIPTTTTQWKVGDICSVLYQSNWWRGVVLTLENFSGTHIKVRVYLIDWGVRCLVKIRDLIKVESQEFFNEPMFAIECRSGNPNVQIGELSSSNDRRCIMVVIEEPATPSAPYVVSLTAPCSSDLGTPKLLTDPLISKTEYQSIVNHEKLKGFIHDVGHTELTDRDLFFLNPADWNDVWKGLNRKINQFYNEANVQSAELEPQFSVGEYVAYPKEGSLWTRGRIIAGQMEPELVTVFQLDFGKTESVKKESVLKLAKQFLPVHYPPAVVACQFWDVDLRRQKDAKSLDTIKSTMDSLERMRAFFYKQRPSTSGQNFLEGGTKWDVCVFGYSGVYPLQLSFFVASSQIGSSRSKLYCIPTINFYEDALKGYPDPYPPVIDDPMDVSVLRFNNSDPSTFYVQLRSQNEWKLSQLEEMLDYIYRGQGSFPLVDKMFPSSGRASNDAHLRPGIMCLVPWTQEGKDRKPLVRTLTLEVESRNKVRVRAIDYGEDFFCDSSDLLWMGDSPVLCDLPPFALKCRFWDTKNLKNVNDSLSAWKRLLVDPKSEVGVAFSSCLPDDDGCFRVLLTINGRNLSAELLANREAEPRLPLGQHVFPRYSDFDSQRRHPASYFICRIAEDKMSSASPSRFLVDTAPYVESSVFSGCRNVGPPVHADDIHPGHSYAVKREGAFARAIALKQKEENGQLWEVELIDYEILEAVEVSAIYTLPLPLLLKFRRLMPCSLAGSKTDGENAEICFQKLLSTISMEPGSLVLRPSLHKCDSRSHSVLLSFKDKERGDAYSVNQIIGRSFDTVGHESELYDLFEKESEVTRSTPDVVEAPEPFVTFKDPPLTEEVLIPEGGEVIAVSSPYCFFFRPDSYRRKFMTLEREMAEHFAAEEKLNRHTYVKTYRSGLACVVWRQRDETYYRARINYYSGDLIRLLYVDIGELDVVRSANCWIYVIPEKFLSVPVLAVICRSTGMAPINVMDMAKKRLPTESDWSQQATNRFKQLTVGRPVKLIEAMTRTQSRYPLALQIKDPTTNQWSDLALKMISDDPPMAIPVAEHRSRTLYPQVLPNDVMLRWVEGIVTWSYNPACFYWRFNCWSADLVPQIETRLKQFSGIPMDPKDMKPGTPCVACYYDGVWNLYRGMIASRDEQKKTCAVIFVDYGNVEESMNEVEIFDVTCDLIALPRTALKCSLDGCHTVFGESVGNDEWLASEEERFLKLTVDSYKQLKISVIDFTMDPLTDEIVLRVRMRNEDGEDIRVQMIPANEPA